MMPDRELAILEFPTVLRRLAGHASFAIGKEMALALRPAPTLSEATRRQRVVIEARWVVESGIGMGIGGARDVRESVRRAGLGGRIEPNDLLDVRATLSAGRVLRRGLLAHAVRVPELADFAAGLPDRPDLETEIGSALDERGNVVDSASATLGRLRAETRTIHGRLMERLQAFLTSSAYRDAIQDPIITTRNGRYVIPVKADERDKIRGVVHDQSSSGATLFVEPLQTLDLNNRLRQVQIEEQQEVERILLALSARVGARSAEILNGQESLGHLDCAFASARLAGELRAVAPDLVEGSGADRTAEIILPRARHPLLSGNVVPIDIRLGGEHIALVITGPNTGGKTVALKTIGLLTLMAMAGLQVPSADGARVRFVDRVYADIGDEQSIAQSLSTFSSHMTHIVAILRAATGSSLVLLDELGAGTDPVEGAALAQAILDELRHRGTLVVATTHYAELKTYAYATSGVANASVEFDVETLSPTYRLMIGAPGRSNALAIAARLGLGEAILETARARVAPRDAELANVLDTLRNEKERVIATRAAAEAEHHRIAALAAQLSEKIAATDRARKKAASDAYKRVEREIADLRARLRDIGADARPAQPGLSSTAVTRRQIDAVEREIRARRPAEVTATPVLIAPGSWVRHRGLDQVGQVLSVRDDEVEIQFRALKGRARRNDIEPATRAEQSRSEPAPDLFTTAGMAPISAIPRTEIEIRGYRADDVSPELDRYLNDAYLAGLPFVRIVHGKGTGALRQTVREFLGAHPLVRGYDSAPQREGGDGVTVATLAN
ncbi:MAG: endonuclease MutS2 [Chloroflexota bacterium]|nr:MAG: endonuclease MutS2 [Chloroflexota bacterium]